MATQRVVKSTYFSNWGDRIGYPLAHLIAKPLSRISFVTPNGVTLTAFGLFAFGCISLVLQYPHHLTIGGLSIFAGYVGDDVDGQLARLTKKYSVLGDYLDKVLDICKIFLVTFFSGLAVYNTTQNILYVLLGFIACFAFLYRYYIKLESMFSALSRDANFLDKSGRVRTRMEAEMDRQYARTAKSFGESIELFLLKNRTFFWFDEAEFAIITAVGAVTNRLDISIWILAIAQVTIVLWRLYERGYQLTTGSDKLLEPMRK